MHACCIWDYLRANETPRVFCCFCCGLLPSPPSLSSRNVCSLFENIFCLLQDFTPSECRTATQTLIDVGVARYDARKPQQNAIAVFFSSVNRPKNIALSRATPHTLCRNFGSSDGSSACCSFLGLHAFAAALIGRSAGNVWRHFLSDGLIRRVRVVRLCFASSPLQRFMPSSSPPPPPKMTSVVCHA